MPIERTRMRPWLENALNEGKFPGVEWLDEEAKTFRLPWKHASRNGWNVNNDASLFRAWAEHTGKYKCTDKPNPKTWKANFRCALNSLPDMVELTEKRTTKGNNAFKVYKIINNDNVVKKGYTSKKMKGRAQRRKKQFYRTRSVEKVSQMKKNNAESIKETTQSYKISSNVKLEYPCNVPQMMNGTHLVDHDYGMTRYFDIYNETTDEDMHEVFDDQNGTRVKTEPLSPQAIGGDREYSLYEESAVDSKNIKTSCMKEDDKIMSDDEVVELIDEMSSDCGSSCGSVDAAMEELFDGIGPLDTDFPSEKTKQRANSAPATFDSTLESSPLDTLFCSSPEKLPRSRSSTDIQALLSITPQEFLQSCL